MDLNEEELKLAEELAEVIAEEDALDKKPKKEIANAVSRMLFGPGIVSKRVSVGWGSLFGKQKCPACNGTLVKTESEYACGKCGIKITAELYEKAREQHARETKLSEREYRLREEMGKSSMPPEKVDDIYALAIERAAEKVRKVGA